jgi:2-polyprenyl-3-methyl-5-hydroxy-6-metoxy-1,4-benzoquinol methylase
MRLRDLPAALAARRNREALYSTADYWNGRSDDCEGDAATMWANNRLNALYHREMMRCLETHLPSVEGMHVLDVGCGTGRLSRYFAERGARVTGVDFAERALRVARDQVQGGNPTYVEGSILDLKLDLQADVAVTWGVLTFACADGADLARACANIRRALRPGGRVLFMEPTHRGFLHRVLRLNLADFRQVVQDSGVQVESVEQMHFWPARLALGYLELPAGLTAGVYHAGQAVMRGLGRGGDYKVLWGTVR